MQFADRAEVRSSRALLFACENLGDVHRADVATAAVQAAVHVHEAAVVAGRDDFGIRAENSIELLVEPKDLPILR